MAESPHYLLLKIEHNICLLNLQKSNLKDVLIPDDELLSNIFNLPEIVLQIILSKKVSCIFICKIY